MAQELSPQAARARLETIRRGLLLVAVLYLVLHIWVSYRALVDSGVVAGVATLLTLGFGDLYWAVYGAGGTLRQPALIAAVMAFASWLSRPWTTTYLIKLGMQSVDWPQARDGETDDDGHATPAAGAGATGPAGGARSGGDHGGAAEDI